MEEQILQAARAGNPAAFEQLVTPYEQRLWRLCWQLLRNTEDAQDCLQETMVKAWRALPQYRGEASLETWLCRIATNTCNDLLRRKQIRKADSLEALRETGYEPPDTHPTPESESLHKDEKERLRQALDRLPEDMRTALILFAIEGFPYEEIAQITGTAVGTVKSRIARGRQRLKEILQDTEQNDFSSVHYDERRRGT